MSCKHNLFLNSNYEEQDTDRIEIDQALFRIKEAVKKSENKTNEALNREVDSLTNSIAQAAETAHHELETTVSGINQNMTELENQLDTNVNSIRSRIDNIIANSTSTEGNSELIDIRTGSDGTVYGSAGSAVRKQLGAIIDKQNAAFNSIPISWKYGKSLDHAAEVDQANRCISDYIEISGRNIEVIVPDNNSVKYSLVFFDSEKQHIRDLTYSTSSNIYSSLLNGSYCKYCRIRAGMSNDSVPAEYPQLTDSFFVRWADSDVMKFRGNILAEGYTSFTQCTQNGYYSFTQADLQGISDAGDFNKGGILMVERNAAARVVFQTILLTDGTQYFRYGSNSFRKCIPDAAELPNSFAYRGEVSNYSVTALSQLTEDGYYDVKWSDRNNLSDYPADLNTSGYLVVYSNTATGRISQELHAISGIIYFRYDNNPFVRIYDPDACEQYRGNIQSLGYTAIRSCTQPGYYSCTQDYLENLTDKPTDLSTGFIVEVHNNASGGVIYQTITDNNGEQWFRHSGNPFVRKNSGGYEKPVWYAIGDSITQGFYSYMNGDTPAISTTTNCWAKIAADKAGFALTNYGVGGSGFVHNATVGDHLNARDHIDTIDFSSADIVTIAFGINDWKGSDTFGTFDDDIAAGGTVYSNMRYVIEKILTDNPGCKIFIITPINASKYGNQSGNWSLSHNINGKTLEDMFQLEKTVADYYGIELIDMTHNSAFNRINCPALLIDGVHPTLKGHQLMGAELSRKIHYS